METLKLIAQIVAAAAAALGVGYTIVANARRGRPHLSIRMRDTAYLAPPSPEGPHHRPITAVVTNAGERVVEVRELVLVRRDGRPVEGVKVGLVGPLARALGSNQSCEFRIHPVLLAEALRKAGDPLLIHLWPVCWDVSGKPHRGGRELFDLCEALAAPTSSPAGAPHTPLEAGQKPSGRQRTRWWRGPPGGRW